MERPILFNSPRKPCHAYNWAKLHLPPLSRDMELSLYLAACTQRSWIFFSRQAGMRLLPLPSLLIF